MFSKGPWTGLGGGGGGLGRFVLETSGIGNAMAAGTARFFDRIHKINRIKECGGVQRRSAAAAMRALREEARRVAEAPRVPRDH